MAFATIEPVSKGHTLLVPKKHWEDLFSIDEEDASALGLGAARLSRKLREENGATGLNLLHASGKDAQQSLPHLHFHLVPRYPNDGLDLWLREGL
jgi:histidine triad (HIT) family protein